MRKKVALRLAVGFVVLVLLGCGALYATAKARNGQSVEYSYPGYPSIESVLSAAEGVVIVSVISDDGVFAQSSGESEYPTHAYRVTIERVLRGDLKAGDQAVFMNSGTPWDDGTPVSTLTSKQRYVLAISVSKPGQHAWIKQYANDIVLPQLGSDASVFAFTSSDHVAPLGRTVKLLDSKSNKVLDRLGVSFASFEAAVSGAAAPTSSVSAVQ